MRSVIAQSCAALGHGARGRRLVAMAVALLLAPVPTRTAYAEGPLQTALASRGLGSSATVLRIAQGSLAMGNLELAARQACNVTDDPEVGADARDVVAATGLTCGTLPTPTVEPEPEIGAMDREDIDAAIKRRLGAIRRCYLRQLGQAPGLEGKVVEPFVIAADGRVAGAAGVPEPPDTQLDAVAACIDGVFMAMKFPAPRGGGIVIVTYPFDFSSDF